VPDPAVAVLSCHTITNILGISAYYHDSATALTGDGETIAAGLQKRVSRMKTDASSWHRPSTIDSRGQPIDQMMFYDKSL
jgi:carbamoyltransferase